MTPAEMRDWIISRLDPIESYDPAKRPTHSDTLNPDRVLDPTTLRPAAVLVPLIQHESGVTVLLTSPGRHPAQPHRPGGVPWRT